MASMAYSLENEVSQFLDIIIMFYVYILRLSWIAVSHNHQSHGSSAGSCLDYTTDTGHLGIYFLVVLLPFSPLNLPGIPKFSPKVHFSA